MNPSLEEIRKIFKKNGATKILIKPLAENDNSKQQIYLGGNFDVLKEIPFGKVVAYSSVKVQNFKAKVAMYWLSADEVFVQAIHAQLILYPSYPEVRLSGFLKGCPVAPSAHMKPVAPTQRGPKNQWDGRVLFMATTDDGKILAYLATRDSTAANDFRFLHDSGEIQLFGGSTVLFALSVDAAAPKDTRSLLITELTRIRALGWINSVRMHATGEILPYRARNGGGYTLEAQLGIKPNSRSEPDYLGWEVKGHSGSRVTLMTPEPDEGYYGKEGAESFVRKYGYMRDDGVIYFTGTHKINVRHARTSQLLTLEGFDSVNIKITNVDGGIYMTDHHDEASAIWTYPGLIEHWGRKHANAVYVKYQSDLSEVKYRYLSPVRLGVGTTFEKYLKGMYDGHVVYDPATKVMPATASTRSKVKARSQFRVGSKKLPELYDEFVPKEI